MQKLINHSRCVVINNTYLQKIFNISNLRLDYEKLKTQFEFHEVVVHISPFERSTSFATRLMNMNNVHITEEASILTTFTEVLMYAHATRQASVDEITYFEIIGEPEEVELVADLYSKLTPNWIFRVWTPDVSYVTNRRNVVCKNLSELDVFSG